MRRAEIVHHWVPRGLLQWLCFSIRTATVLDTPWRRAIHRFVGFWVLLAGRFNEVSVEVLREGLLHLSDIHLGYRVRRHLGVIRVLQTPLAPQVR